MVFSVPIDLPVTATNVCLTHGPGGAFCCHADAVGSLKAVLEVSVSGIIVSAAHDPCEATLWVWSASGAGHQEDDYQLPRENKWDLRVRQITTQTVHQ